MYVRQFVVWVGFEGGVRTRIMEGGGFFENLVGLPWSSVQVVGLIGLLGEYGIKLYT